MELMPQYDKAISQGGQDYVAHASSPLLGLSPCLNMTTG